jgi:hypothetical protein
VDQGLATNASTRAGRSWRSMRALRQGPAPDRTLPRIAPMRVGRNCKPAALSNAALAQKLQGDDPQKHRTRGFLPMLVCSAVVAAGTQSPLENSISVLLA